MINKIMLIIIIALLPAAAAAATIHVSWDANTEPDLAGYNVYYGEKSRVYGQPVDVGKDTEHIVSVTPEHGQAYYFAVTAYDTSGNESEFSDEASLFIQDGVPPAKPKDLVARIVDAVISWFRGLWGPVAARVA